MNWTLIGIHNPDNKQSLGLRWIMVKVAGNMSVLAGWHWPNIGSSTVKFQQSARWTSNQRHLSTSGQQNCQQNAKKWLLSGKCSLISHFTILFLTIVLQTVAWAVPVKKKIRWQFTNSNMTKVLAPSRYIYVIRWQLWPNPCLPAICNIIIFILNQCQVWNA